MSNDIYIVCHSITEHVYAADGRKKEPHPNPLPCFDVIL